MLNKFWGTIKLIHRKLKNSRNVIAVCGSKQTARYRVIKKKDNETPIVTNPIDTILRFHNVLPYFDINDIATQYVKNVNKE